MITPELERQLEAAEKSDKTVEAVVVLKPTVKTKQFRRFVSAMIDRHRAHGGVTAFEVFEKLGSFSIAASPRVIRSLDGEAEIWRITPNRP